MKLIPISIFLVTIIASNCVKAQGSMMEEVSYPYLHKLVRIAKENYPRVGLNQKRIDIADKNVYKAKLSWFDVLGFYFLYNPTSSTQLVNPTFLGKTFNGSQFGMTISIGTIFQKPVQVKIARDELDIARLQYHEYDLNIEAIVKDRYFQYVEQVTIVKARARSVLDAGIMLNSLRNKFEKGEETFENYSKALILYNDQSQLKINAEASMLSAKAFLEEILNKKLDEIN
jgi:outer membrane protein TolC